MKDEKERKSTKIKVIIQYPKRHSTWCLLVSIHSHTHTQKENRNYPQEQFWNVPSRSTSHCPSRPITALQTQHTTTTHIFVGRCCGRYSHFLAPSLCCVETVLNLLRRRFSTPGCRMDRHVNVACICV